MRHLLISMLAASVLALVGCTSAGCKSNTPGPVHPTDDQINNAPGGEATKDPPYTPWWAEMGF